MKSGAVVLTSGRPAIGLWVASSRNFTGGKDQHWDFHNVRSSEVLEPGSSTASAAVPVVTC